MVDNDRRLIEDILPIETLNAIAAKEKKHPKHPLALVHYWPARRPITASRAAVYGALVSEPASEAEREEAVRFVERLASFNVDPKVLEQARGPLSPSTAVAPPRSWIFSPAAARFRSKRRGLAATPSPSSIIRWHT